MNGTRFNRLSRTGRARHARLAAAAVVGLATALVVGCGNNPNDAANGNGAETARATEAAPSSNAAPQPGPAETVEPKGQDTYTLGFVAKSAGNPVYAAARAGATEKAAELAAEHDIQINIEWRAPEEESARSQTAHVAELLGAGVDGLAISVTDPTVVTPAIERAVEQGVPVVTFDADAEDSSRFAFYGIDDQAAGEMLMARLAEVMPSGGSVAVLAGNRAATNLRDRVIGFATAPARTPEMHIAEVVHHDETPEAAARAMADLHASGAEIDAWALVGGWPLYMDGGLDGVPPDVKIVSMDPLPPALDKMQDGRVQGLIAQPYDRWGEEPVRLLIERLHLGQLPPAPVIEAELELITSDDAESYRARWESWVGGEAG